MILILAGREDVHARRVGNLVQERGQAVRIVDCADFGEGACLSYSPGKRANAKARNGEYIDFESVQSVWYRRPRYSQIGQGIEEPAVRSFCRQEWTILLDGLFLGSQARFINPLLAEFAAVKPRQLQVAASIGLNVPETLITNDPDEASAFIEWHKGKVVHKAMASPKDRLLDTRMWSGDDMPLMFETLKLAPTMFQSLVRGPADVRVTVVGDRLFAAKIDTARGNAGLDSRLDMDAPFEEYVLPWRLEGQLRSFMADMGLVYGTVDLKISDEGEYFFLEVNPQGQFLYVEILTGMPISEAMAELLADSSA